MCTKFYATHFFIAVCEQIDREGRVVDLDKNKGKLQIIEQEFKKAEKEEELRMKEEAEIRVRNFPATFMVAPYPTCSVACRPNATKRWRRPERLKE